MLFTEYPCRSGSGMSGKLIHHVRRYVWSDRTVQRGSCSSFASMNAPCARPGTPSGRVPESGNFAAPGSPLRRSVTSPRHSRPSSLKVSGVWSFFREINLTLFVQAEWERKKSRAH